MVQTRHRSDKYEGREIRGSMQYKQLGNSEDNLAWCTLARIVFTANIKDAIRVANSGFVRLLLHFIPMSI